jgi:hypothetical protein
MIELRVVEDLGREEWITLLRQCGGNPLHLPEVSFGDWPEASLRYLLFQEEGRVVACGPGFLGSSSTLRPWRRPALELPTPPAGAGACGERGRREIYQALLEHCRRAGIGRLGIGHSWGDSFGDLESFRGSITDSVTEFILDLRPGPDSILAGMHKTYRRNIGRARRQGLQVRGESTLDALYHLRRVQLDSSERASSQGRGFAVRDPDYFQKVHQRIYAEGTGEVLLAMAGEECVGALAWLAFGGRGMTVRSGCTTDGYERYAMYLLHGALLERAGERGLLEVNLGGVPAAAAAEDHPQHGLYQFKKGFGGEPRTRTSVMVKVG